MEVGVVLFVIEFAVVLCAIWLGTRSGGVGPGVRGRADHFLRIAEQVFRASPAAIARVAPFVTWTFTVVAGTGHVVYPCCR